MDNNGDNCFEYPYKAMSPVDGTQKEFKSIDDVYGELLNCYNELEEKNIENKPEAIYSEHYFFCNTSELLDRDMQSTIKKYNFCKMFNCPPFPSLNQTPGKLVDDFMEIELIMKTRAKNNGR